MAKKKQEANNNGNIHPTRIFQKPDDLYNAFIAYKEHLKQEAANWPKIQYVGKDGEKKTDNPVMPMIMDGFEVFCYENHGCVNQYFDNKDGYYDDFVIICSRVRKEIRSQQITGGLLNQFNTSITQRLNNLKDSSDITTDGKPITPESVSYELVLPKPEDD